MDFLEEIRKINEAYCLRRGLPVKRRFTDDELRMAHHELELIESRLFGKCTLCGAAADFDQLTCLRCAKGLYGDEEGEFNEQRAAAQRERDYRKTGNKG